MAVTNTKPSLSCCPSLETNASFSFSLFLFLFLRGGLQHNLSHLSNSVLINQIADMAMQKEYVVAIALWLGGALCACRLYCCFPFQCRECSVFRSCNRYMVTFPMAFITTFHNRKIWSAFCCSCVRSGRRLVVCYSGVRTSRCTAGSCPVTTRILEARRGVHRSRSAQGTNPQPRRNV